MSSDEKMSSVGELCKNNHLRRIANFVISPLSVLLTALIIYIYLTMVNSSSSLSGGGLGSLCLRRLFLALSFLYRVRSLDTAGVLVAISRLKYIEELEELVCMTYL